MTYISCLLLWILGLSPQTDSLVAQGAWRQRDVKWNRPPAKLHLKERYAEALPYFAANHAALIHCGSRSAVALKTLSRLVLRMLFAGPCAGACVGQEEPPVGAAASNETKNLVQGKVVQAPDKRLTYSGVRSFTKSLCAERLQLSGESRFVGESCPRCLSRCGYIASR